MKYSVVITLSNEGIQLLIKKKNTGGALTFYMQISCNLEMK